MTTTPVETSGTQAFDSDDLSAKAREHLWMHFTRMSSYAQAPVPTIVRGQGARIYDIAGQEYLDGAGRAVRGPGRDGREELARAAYDQAKELAFFPLWSYAHPPAIDLADRLASYAPGDLNKVFFTTGGGEAVETAWKLAKQYFKLVGKPMKHKVISRAVAYHGTPQGALSITGIPDGEAVCSNRWFPARIKVPNTNFLPRTRARRQPRGLRTLGGRPDRDGHRDGGTGHRRLRVPRARPELRGLLHSPPPGYFQRVREICDKSRCPARIRRSDLRLRPAGHHVRRATSSTTCRT